MATVSDLKRLLTSINTARSRLTSATRDRADNETLDLGSDEFRDIPDLLRDIRSAIGALDLGRADTAKRGRIDSFFREVGLGMIEAQKALDAESSSYNLDRPAAQRTQFRVPKVNAEITFGIEKTDSKGFNIFIASSESTESRSMQHHVSFDIVAAPLPPDLIQAASAAAVTAGFTTNFLDREALRGSLRRLADDGAAAGSAEAQTLLVAYDGARFDRLLILDLPEAWWIVAVEKEEAQLRFWTLSREADAFRGFSPPTSLNGKGQALNDLFQMLHALSERQAALLGSLRQALSGG
jgi:hypothetical protein